MKIAVDLQSCQSGSRHGGIGRYSLDLLKAMIRCAPEHEFHVLLSNLLPEPIPHIRASLRDLIPPTQIHVMNLPGNVSWMYGDHKRISAAEIIREDFILKLNPDVLHISSFFEGCLEDVVCSIHRLESKIPVVVTIYDLIPLVDQESYLKNTDVRNFYLNKVQEIQKADSLLAISQYTADQAGELLTNFDGQITNIRGGVDSKFRVLESVDWGSWRETHGITKPFLLYTASFDVRKNHERLIRAFAEVDDAVRKNHQLVIVGEGSDVIYDYYRGVGVSIGLNVEDLIFTGRVSDSNLVNLYNECKLFVFPSLSEGLGLPIVEAMACGAAVVGSNTTSLPEFLATSEASFDPLSVHEIAEKVELFAGDKTRLEKLRSLSAKHVSQFTWLRSAEGAMSALTTVRQETIKCKDSVPSFSPVEAVKTLRLGGITSDELSHCLACNEVKVGSDWARNVSRRVGWVTTWGTRCGIASYSENMIDHMPNKPIVFAPLANARRQVAAVDAKQCWQQGKADDLSELRAALLEAELDELMIQFNFGFFRFESLTTLIEEQCDRNVSVFVTLHSTSEMVLNQATSALEETLGKLVSSFFQCAAILVHTEADRERLVSLGLTNVLVIPQGIKTLKECDHRKKTQSSAKTIASYGFFLPGKGLFELVGAMGILANQGCDINLLMVNADYGGEYSDLVRECRDRIEMSEVPHRFRLIDDYLEDKESLRLLSSADLVVFPYQNSGESSSAAVRMGIASGRPVAVTPLPIFNDVSEIVMKLPGTDEKSLANGIINCLDEIEAKSGSAVLRHDTTRMWVRSHEFANVSSYVDHMMSSHSLGVEIF